MTLIFLSPDSSFKAIVASVNPVPVFSSSQGLLSVVALYPNSSSSSPRKDVIQANIDKSTKSKGTRGNYEYLDKRGHQQIWNEACACYKPKESSNHHEYDTTTYTTTTATGLITLKPIPTRKPKPTPTPKPKPRPEEEEPQEMQVDPGAFAGPFLGMTGACLQRRSGVLVCTSNSL